MLGFGAIAETAIASIEQVGGGSDVNQSGVKGSVVYTGKAGQGSLLIGGAKASILYTGKLGNGAVTVNQTGAKGSVLYTGKLGQGSIIAQGVKGSILYTGNDGNGVIGYTQSGVAASILLTGNDGQGSIVALGANGVVTLTGKDGSGVTSFAQTGAAGGLVFTGKTGNGVADNQDVEYGSGPFTYPHALRKRKQEAEKELDEQVKRTIRRIAKGVAIGKRETTELDKIKDFASLDALRRSVEFYAAIEKSLAMRKAQDNLAAQETVRLFILDMERKARQMEEDDIAFLMMQIVADID